MCIPNQEDSSCSRIEFHPGQSGNLRTQAKDLLANQRRLRRSAPRTRFRENVASLEVPDGSNWAEAIAASLCKRVVSSDVTVAKELAEKTEGHVLAGVSQEGKID
jgi:Ribonuclease G/E